MNPNYDFDEKLSKNSGNAQKLEAGVNAVWTLLFSNFPAHILTKNSGNSQKLEAGVDAATQHGQEANVAKGTPTAVLWVTCKWKNIFKKIEQILEIRKWL